MHKLTLLFFILLLLITGCVPGTEKASIDCAAGQSFDQVQRKCVGPAAIATISTNPEAPVNSTSTASMTEDTAKVIYLSYSDANGDLATSCSVTTLLNLSITTACACTAGVCKVTLTPTANYYSSANPFYFYYNVTANSNTSASTKVTVTVDAIDDAPIITNTTITNISAASVVSYGASPGAFTDDEDDSLDPIYVTVSFTDVDRGTTSVNYLSTSNISFNSSSCSYTTTTSATGTCTFSYYSASNFYGAAGFTFNLQSLSGVTYTGSSPFLVTGSFAGVDDAPVNSSLGSLTFTEDTETIVTLAYTDVEGDLAIPGTTGCAISAETNLTETTTCSCSSGVCTVGLTPNADLNSSNTASFSFDFQIQSFNTALVTSTWSSASTVSSITVSSVSDLPAPTASNQCPSGTPCSVTEDTATNIVLFDATAGHDPDSSSTSLSTSCSVSSFSSGSGTCSCSAGICTLAYTPASNVNSSAASLNGNATFSYTITRDTRTSTAQTGYIDITAVDDAPSLSISASSADGNLNTPIYIQVTLGEGGGSDEDTQAVTLSSTTSSNTTLVATGSITLAEGYNTFSDSGDVDTESVWLKIVPTTGEFGTTSITFTISDGTTTTTSSSIAITVSPVYAVHNGWKHIKAVGDIINAEGTTETNKYVRLEWEDFSLYGSSLHTTTAFNVYRGTSAAGNIDYTTPINTSAIPSTQTYYVDTDSSLTAGTTYYYAVRPIDTTYSKPIAPVTQTSTTTLAESTYGSVKIVMPASNMALVHPWAMNKEVCQKMGKEPDEDNDFRCSYEGPGSVLSGGNLYYQQTVQLHYDVAEMGCNFSRTECTANGCIGFGDPETTGCDGDACSASNASITSPILYYDRSTATCYYTTDNTNWSAVDTTFATTYASLLTLNSIKNPPLAKVNAQLAQDICNARSARLPKRMEFVAASAWDLSLSDTTIDTYETGTNLSSTPGCNSSAGAGLTFSANESLPSTDTDTLPGTVGTSHRSLITYSNSTSNCRSRYGIGDLTGNVKEYNLDTTDCLLFGGEYICGDSDNISDLLATFNTLLLDGSGNIFQTSANAMTSFSRINTSSTTTSWKIADKQNYGTQFLLPQGVPFHSSGTIDGLLSINSSAPTITPTQLHNDMFTFNPASFIPVGGTAAVITSGGAYNSGAGAGRYSAEYVDQASSAATLGFRCVIEN